jgi:hypothetical protein
MRPGLLAVMFAAVVLLGTDSRELKAQTPPPGGPLILIGLDTEDHCVGESDHISAYANIVNGILADVQNGGNGIVVLGGGKSSSDEVTRCWNEIVKSASGPNHRGQRCGHC